MLHRNNPGGFISTGLLLAALVASGPAQAAQTTSGGRSTPPAGGRTAAPAAGRPTAPAAAKTSTGGPVTPADMKAILGTWTIPLETPTGRLVANLVFRVEGGKVVAGISAPQFKEHKITDITKAGQVLTLKASTEYSGPLTAYSGPVAMVLTLRPKGPDMAAWFDFNNAGYQLGATPTNNS
jgi:hypothetical protein